MLTLGACDSSAHSLGMMSTPPRHPPPQLSESRGLQIRAHGPGAV